MSFALRSGPFLLFMTWKQFKDQAERLGVKDDSTLQGIDLDFRFGEPGLDVVLTPDFDHGVMIYASTFGKETQNTL